MPHDPEAYATTQEAARDALRANADHFRAALPAMAAAVAVDCSDAEYLSGLLELLAEIGVLTEAEVTAAMTAAQAAQAEALEAASDRWMHGYLYPDNSEHSTYYTTPSGSVVG